MRIFESTGNTVIVTLKAVNTMRKDMILMGLLIVTIIEERNP